MQAQGSTQTSAPAAKTFVAVFSRKGAEGPKIELFKSRSQHERAPLFDGKIGDKHVSLFVRQGRNGPFLSLVGDKIAEGQYEDLGTANVMLSTGGTPFLEIKMGEQTLSASISKKVDQDMLAKMGMNPDSFVAIFSRNDDSGPKIAIKKSRSQHERAPMFAGQIGDKHVSLFLRNGSKGAFLGVVGDKGDDGQSENLGTANVVLSQGGAPRLAIKLGEQTLFASISKQIDQDMLVKMGLNVERQAQRRAARTTH